MAINTGINVSKAVAYGVLSVKQGLNVSKIVGYAVLALDPDKTSEINDNLNYWSDAVAIALDFPVTVAETINLFADNINPQYNVYLVNLTQSITDSFILLTGPPANRMRGLQDGFATLAAPDFELELNTDDIGNFLKDDVTIAFDEFFNAVGPGLAYDTMQFNWQDNVDVFIVIPRNVSDALNLFDAIEKFSAIDLDRGDSLTLLDFVNSSRNVLPIAFDTMEMQDGEVAFTLAVHEERSAADSLLFSDAINLLRSTSFLSYIRRYLNDVP